MGHSECRKALEGSPPLLTPHPRAPGETRLKSLKSQTANPPWVLVRSECLDERPNSHSGDAELCALSLQPPAPASPPAAGSRWFYGPRIE